MPNNIYKVQTGYQVRLVRQGTSYSKTFDTKREARAWRDQKLKEIPPIERPEQWAIQGRTGVKGIGFTWKQGPHETERKPYVTCQWPENGRWRLRARSVHAYGLEGALTQCLHVLEDVDYLEVPIEEAKATALPRLENLLEEEQA